jgi:uncharacterized membrane protein
MDAASHDGSPARSRFPHWLVALPFSWGYGIYLMSILPARVPAHWNMAGQIDRYGAPWEAAFLLPLVMTVEASLFYFLWRKNPSLAPLFDVILGFMLCIHLLVGYSARTSHLPTLIFSASPLIGLIPVALSWAYGAWLYSRLPERVPIHWGLHGEVDGWGNRFTGAFLLPILVTVLSGAMLAIAREAPVILMSGFLFALQLVLGRIQLSYRGSATP